jgi:hypothetical protein
MSSSKTLPTPNDGSLQKQLYLPQFLNKPIDSSKFPDTCLAPRVAQRGIEVSSMRLHNTEHVQQSVTNVFVP